MLEANAAAIVIVLVVLALAVLLVAAGRRRRRLYEDDDEGKKPTPPKVTAPKTPASKEVFAAAPPKPAPATKAEPAKAEPAKAEAPKKAEPVKAEPVKAEPVKAEPPKAELVKAEPPKAEVPKAEPVKAEPVKAEAPKAEPAKAETKAEKKAAKAAEKAADKADDEVPWELREDEPKKGSKVEAPKAEAKVEPARAEPKPAEKVAEEPPPRTLKDGLGRTRKEGFIARLGSLFAGKVIDQDVLEQVEEVLFTSDIGVRTADRLIGAVKDALTKKELKDENKVWEVLRLEATKILEQANAAGKVGTPKPGEPFVTMVLGVNGTGKTTSIGKLAHKLLAEGKRVTLVAGDTFRAAATEQLEHWGRRVGAPVIGGKENADPASVVFDGVKQGLADKAEFILVDTAGRLHTNVNLMDELKKVRRVMGRAIEGSPHEVLMVLDATTGQNGITQAKMFKDATEVTGIILTKLDGTAKGGVVLGVCDELKIPIKWVGVGERVADMRPFDPREFVDELFQPPT